MEKIIVQDFGPIGYIEIILEKINLFTGDNASGKSTAAKLISIFKGNPLPGHTNFDGFIKLLSDYNIAFEIRNSTKIRYENDSRFFELNGKSIQTNYLTENTNDTCNLVFIPSERIFFPAISEHIFSLLSADVPLPKRIIDFGAKFEEARSSIKELQIDFLGVTYKYENNTDYVVLADNIKIKLSQASSGFQSVIPLILVLHFNTEHGKELKNIFVIEEPELNLSPASQKDLFEHVISRVEQSKDKIIITTHSPQFLNSVDGICCNYFREGGCKSG